MRKRLLSFFIISVVLACCCKQNLYNLEPNRKYKDYVVGINTNTKPILWNSKKGIKMLKETKYSKPFYKLAHHYAGQQNLTSCEPASARIILSAIYENTNTQFSQDKLHSLYKEKNGIERGRFLITEENMFDVNTDKSNESMDYGIITRQKKHKSGKYKGKYDGGMAIQSLADVISKHPNVKVSVFRVSKNDIKQRSKINSFRNLIKQAMSQDGKYIISNYNLNAVYPYNGGHFSPIVAYNMQTDMVLIMDVAAHLGIWYWVKLEELYKSMIEVKDEISNEVYRGYILVEQIDRKSKGDNDK